MRTQRLVLEGPRRAVLAPYDLPPPGHGEVLVEVEQCGLCSTEVHQWLGHTDGYPLAAGHEIAGLVRDAGDGVGRLAPGDRVVGWIPGGGMAGHVVARAEHLFTTSADLPRATAAEPLGCCVNTVRLADPPEGADVLIVGTGFIALLLLQLSLLHAPRSVVVAGRRASGLALAASAGATHTVDLGRQDPAAALADLTDGRGADVVYETTGSQHGLALAERAPRTEGTLAIVGYHQDGRRSVDLELWNRQALRIANAHFRDLATVLDGMRRGMELVEAGTIDPAPLYSHRFALAEAPAAFELASRRPEGFVKGLVAPAG